MLINQDGVLGRPKVSTDGESPFEEGTFFPLTPATSSISVTDVRTPINLLAQITSDFEGANILSDSYWSAYGGNPVISTDKAYNGSKAIKMPMTPDLYYAGPMLYGFNFLTPGKTYILSFKFWAPSNRSVSFAYIHNGNESFWANAVGNDDWQTISFPVRISATGYGYFRAIANCYWWETAYDFFIDDAWCYEYIPSEGISIKNTFQDFDGLFGDRTNLVTEAESTMELGTPNYRIQGTGVTATVSTDYAYQGSKSLKITVPGTAPWQSTYLELSNLVEGKRYSLHLYMRSPARSKCVIWHESNPNINSQTQGEDYWKRAVFVFTATAGVNKVYFGGYWMTAGTYYIDNVWIEEGYMIKSAETQLLCSTVSETGYSGYNIASPGTLMLSSDYPYDGAQTIKAIINPTVYGGPMIYGVNMKGGRHYLFTCLVWVPSGKTLNVNIDSGASKTVTGNNKWQRIATPFYVPNDNPYWSAYMLTYNSGSTAYNVYVTGSRLIEYYPDSVSTKRFNALADQNASFTETESLIARASIFEERKNLLVPEIAGTKTLNTWATAYGTGTEDVDLITDGDESYIKVTIPGTYTYEGILTNVYYPNINHPAGTVCHTEKGKTYSLSASVLIESGHTIEFFAYSGNRDYTEMNEASVNITGTGQWQRVEIQLLQGWEENWMTLYFDTPFKNGAFTYYVKDLQIEEGISATEYEYPGASESLNVRDLLTLINLEDSGLSEEIVNLLKTLSDSDEAVASELIEIMNKPNVEDINEAIEELFIKVFLEVLDEGFGTEEILKIFFIKYYPVIIELEKEYGVEIDLEEITEILIELEKEYNIKMGD